MRGAHRELGIIAGVFVGSMYIAMIAGSALAVPVGKVTEADIISLEVSQAAGKKVSDIMSSPAASIAEDTKIQELGKILADRKVPSLFVLNKDSQPIGTVSSSDVLKAVDSHGQARGTYCYRLRLFALFGIHPRACPWNSAC